MREYYSDSFEIKYFSLILWSLCEKKQTMLNVEITRYGFRWVHE